MLVDVSRAWIIATVIIAGFTIAATFREKGGLGLLIGGFIAIYFKFLLLSTGLTVLFFAGAIDWIFNTVPLDCQPVGQHPYAHLPDPSDISDRFAWISSPCTISGKILPWAMIGLAILTCLWVMKEKSDS